MQRRDDTNHRWIIDDVPQMYRNIHTRSVSVL